MESKEILSWLLKGDVAIKYQVYRDLLSEERSDLRQRVALEGWGAKYLANRRKDGHWGIKYYQPKWTSTHYTLCDLRSICVPKDHKLIRQSIDLAANAEKGIDGGINPSPAQSSSDVCINGMFLNVAAYFGLKEEKLKSIVDFILSQHMRDGGFNCRSNRSGARHSSMHTTLSILEGITEYIKNKYTYRVKELAKAQLKSEEFILLHRLFLSDRTGQIIHKDFLRFAYPRRWKYDILSALDYFQYAGSRWDDRMQPAVDVVLNKRNKNGTWNLNAKHLGRTHFEMEKAGKPSRWNTLRALRVLQHFDVKFD